MDLGSAFPSGQLVLRRGDRRRRYVDCWHLAECLRVLGPVTIAHSAFVHANLDWTLGPLRYVIATPVFHRWHHTAADRGGEKNFAATFPVLDLIFGTFHMPAGKLPDRYGIADRDFPTSFGAQLARPFRQ